VAVQYPGREDRHGEPLIDDMTVLTARVCAALESLTSLPYALFGHSMGSAVAYEVAQRLRSSDLGEPQHLLVSGGRAPGDRAAGNVHLRDDNALCAELLRLGGTEQQVLDNAELRSIFLPYVRNDYRLIERYEPTSSPPLNCPVSVFVGLDDPELTAEQAQGWARVTHGPLDVQTFPGDHFYLTQRRREVVAAVSHRLVRGPNR
jgi:surfactin synthase thioesterase subunit